MKKNGMKTAVVVAILLAVVFLFLCVAISGVMHRHECIGENCRFCAAVCFLRELFGSLLLLAFSAMVVNADAILRGGRSQPRFSSKEATPVSLKVKISC